MSARIRVASGVIRNEEKSTHNGEPHMLQYTQKHMGNTVGSQQGEIIIGSLLGDGFLERNGKYLRFVKDHTISQRSYVEWTMNQLTDFDSTIHNNDRYDLRTGRKYHHCILRTKTSSKLEPYSDLFYQKGSKRIPKDLPNMITPRILSVWIMDDGYKRNDCNAMRLNTQSYSIDEHEIILRALAKLGLQATVHKQNKYFVTYISSRFMDQLRQLVQEYIIPEMKYKIA